MKQIKKEILKELKALIELYPTQDVCLHLGTILADYPVIEDLTDKEFLFALEKYATERELNDSIPHKEDIEGIIKDGMNLDIIYEEDDY